MKLFEALDNLNSDVLKTRIYQLGVTPKECPTRKDERVQFLYKFLLSRRLDPFVLQLTDKERTMIAEVVHNQHGRIVESQLVARFGSLPQGYTQEKRHYGYRKPVKKIASVISIFYFNDIIPQELCERLCEQLEKPKTDYIKTTESSILAKFLTTVDDDRHNGLPLSQRDMEICARQEIYSLLRLVDQGKISISEKTLKPTAACIKAVHATLYEGDFFSEADEKKDYTNDTLSPIRSFIWPLLIQSGGLTRRVGKKLTLSTQGKKVLQHQTPYADALKTIYSGWRKQGKLDEFLRVNRIKGQTKRGRGRFVGPQMPPPSLRRLQLEEILLSTPTDEWVQVDEWMRFVRSSTPFFLVSENPYVLYLVDSNYGNINHNFKVLEGRYILAYLFEILSTLGMVDLIYSAPHDVRSDYYDTWGGDDYSYLSRYDGLGWFRINPLGAYCLGICTEYQPAEHALPALLHPLDEGTGFTLLRKPEAHEQLLLEPFTTQKPTEIGQPLLFDMQQGLSAIEQGNSLNEVKALLEKESDSKLSDEMEDFFDSLKMRTESLHEGEAARMVECASEHLVQLLTSAKETSKFCLFSNKKTVVVAEKSYRSFLKGVRTLGYRISPKGVH